MSCHLQLSPRDKLRIERLYAKGLKPAEICAELPSLQLTPRQVTQFLYKRGWTKRRTEIEEAKQQTALEILERARREGVEDFEGFLRDIATGLKIDANRLRDGWELVDDASDAASLMRAKSLLLNRGFQLFGTEKAGGHQPQAALTVGMFVVRAEEEMRADPTTAAKPVSEEGGACD